MNFSIGNDHAGVDYKEAIVSYLRSKGHQVTNHGTDTEASVDYPDFIHPVAKDVSSKTVDLGIIICGSGNGASMTANKYQDIRSALIHVLGAEEGKIIAYSRILERGLSYKEHNAIGRIVVSEAFRSRKIGHELVAFSIEATKKIYPKTTIKISAQAHLKNFYEEHKFQIDGQPYLEDGIPHVGMVLLEL